MKLNIIITSLAITGGFCSNASVLAQAAKTETVQPSSDVDPIAQNADQVKKLNAQVKDLTQRVKDREDEQKDATERKGYDLSVISAQDKIINSYKKGAEHDARFNDASTKKEVAIKDLAFRQVRLDALVKEIPDAQKLLSTAKTNSYSATNMQIGLEKMADFKSGKSKEEPLKANQSRIDSAQAKITDLTQRVKDRIAEKEDASNRKITDLNTIAAQNEIINFYKKAGEHNAVLNEASAKKDVATKDLAFRQVRLDALVNEIPAAQKSLSDSKNDFASANLERKGMSQMNDFLSSKDKDSLKAYLETRNPKKSVETTGVDTAKNPKAESPKSSSGDQENQDFRKE